MELKEAIEKRHSVRAYKTFMLAVPQGTPKRFANRIIVSGCPTSGAVFHYTKRV